MTYRILSLDGGGIRGLLTSKLLERLDKEYCKDFLQKVDLIAGTSTGGILALGLAAGKSPAEMGEIYEEKGAEIFAKSIRDRMGDIERFFYSDYENKALAKELTQVFGEKRLKDLNKKVLISSFQLDCGPVVMPAVRSWKPKFFHNYEYRSLDPNKPPEYNKDRDEKAVDVALRTSAAPTFFPLYQGYADGGLVANNPSMCALAQALDAETGGQKLEDIRLLSIGTGVTPKWVQGVNEAWGFKQWAPYLIDIMMDGVSGVADYQCRQLLGDDYLRVNGNFEHNVSLDSITEIPHLLTVAETTNLGAATMYFDKFLA